VLTDESGDPVHPDAAVILSSAYFAIQHLEAARDVAVWLEANEPDKVRGTLLLSAAVEGLGDPTTAERILRQGLTAHPGDLRLYLALAESRRNRADRVGELGIYHEILALAPDHHATLMAKADAEIELGQRGAAMKTLEIIERKYPSDLRATLRLAFLDYEGEAWESAERRFSRAAAAMPGQTELAFFLGVVRLEAGLPDEALAALDPIEPGEDRYVDARIQVAHLYEERGDLARAIDSLDRALAAEPRRAVQLYRSSLKARAGERDGAISDLEAMLVPDHPDVEVLYQIGLLHGEGGRSGEALAWMERVLEADDSHAAALNYVGYALAEQGEDLDQAERLISRALEVRPDDGFITDSLGWVFFQRAQPLLERGHEGEARGWLLRAETELLRAEKLSGGDPVISEHLGDVYRALGRAPDALARYEDAMARGHRPMEQPELESKLDALRKEMSRP
jgi:tetratricopeptide (TPR) repeat protein